MSKTIFERIIDREVPADIWYEDDKSLAFLDIKPISKGHSLYITKAPYPWIQDIPPNVLGEMFSKVPTLIHALKTTLDCDYVQLAVMGLDVPHFHLHLIPRNFGDKHNELYPAKNLDFDKKELLEQLNTFLQSE